MVNKLKSTNFISITCDSQYLYITLKERQLIIATLTGDIVDNITYKELSWFNSITVDQASDTIILVDNSQIMRLDKSGIILDRNKYAELWQPGGVKVNSQGTIYVADTNNYEIKVFDHNLKLISTIGGENDEKINIPPFGIAIDERDRLYVTNLVTPEIYILNPTGEILDIITPEKSNVPFQSTMGIAIHGEYLYLADTVANQVRKYQINFDFLEQGKFSDSGEKEVIEDTN